MTLMTGVISFFRRALLVVSIFGAFSVASEGAVIHNNLGPGDAVDFFAYGIGSKELPEKSTLGAAFKAPSGNWALDSLSIAVGPYGDPQDILVSLSVDAGGVPGPQLEVFQIPGPPSDQVVDIESTNHPVLKGYSQYWITVTIADDFGMMRWVGSPQREVGWQARRVGSGPWSPYLAIDGEMPAFRIEGTLLAPEPNTLGMLALALIFILPARRLLFASARRR